MSRSAPRLAFRRLVRVVERLSPRSRRGKCPGGWQTRIVDDSRSRYRRHPPDQLAPWVFLQHQVWVDQAGAEHEIESMPLAYVRAVIRFCHEQAHRIITIVTIELWRRRWRLGVPMAADPLDWSSSDEDASEWLERTPVMIALRRREDRLDSR